MRRATTIRSSKSLVNWVALVSIVLAFHLSCFFSFVLCSLNLFYLSFFSLSLSISPLSLSLCTHHVTGGSSLHLFHSAATTKLTKTYPWIINFCMNNILNLLFCNFILKQKNKIIFLFNQFVVLFLFVFLVCACSTRSSAPYPTTTTTTQSLLYTFSTIYIQSINQKYNPYTLLNRNQAYTTTTD